MSDLSAESLSAIREIMDKAKNITAYASSPKLSEADTRAVLIDPLLRALGYEDVSDITREYYVRTPHGMPSTEQYDTSCDAALSVNSAESDLASMANILRPCNRIT